MNTSKTKLALVTGGAGFIGSHVVERLIAEGWQVRVLDDLSTGHLRNIEAVRDRVEFLEGSITDAELLRRATEGVEAIFHLAAKVFVPESFEKPEEYERVNVQGTALLLEAAKKAGVRRIVFSSTCAVYGDTTELPIAETAPTKPLSPYAANKLAAEELGRKAAMSGGPAFTALRYFNVYGPRQDPRSAYSGVISRFIDALDRGALITIFGDGRQTRDFIHVGDVARANVLAGEAPGTSATYNVGTGRETSVAELCAMLAGAPAEQMAQFRPARPGDICRSVATANLIHRELGFVASREIGDGLREMLHANAEIPPRDHPA